MSSKIKYIGPPAEKLVFADGLTLPTPAELEGERYEALLPHHPQLARYYEKIETRKPKAKKKDAEDE